MLKLRASATLGRRRRRTADADRHHAIVVPDPPDTPSGSLTPHRSPETNARCCRGRNVAEEAQSELRNIAERDILRLRECLKEYKTEVDRLQCQKKLLLNQVLSSSVESKGASTVASLGTALGVSP